MPVSQKAHSGSSSPRHSRLPWLALAPVLFLVALPLLRGGDSLLGFQISLCGDGVVDPGQQCDDGNLNNFDGCTRACMIEKGWSCSGQPSHCRCATTARECGLTACGNGILDPGEECDSGSGITGNGTPGNVCNANCSLRDGFACQGRIGDKPLCSRDVNLVVQEQRRLRSAAERRFEGAAPSNLWLWLNPSRSRAPAYPRARYPGRT